MAALDSMTVVTDEFVVRAVDLANVAESEFQYLL